MNSQSVALLASLFLASANGQGLYQVDSNGVKWCPSFTPKEGEGTGCNAVFGVPCDAADPSHDWTWTYGATFSKVSNMALQGGTLLGGEYVDDDGTCGESVTGNMTEGACLSSHIPGKGASNNINNMAPIWLMNCEEGQVDMNFEMTEEGYLAIWQERNQLYLCLSLLPEDHEKSMPGKRAMRPIECKTATSDIATWVADPTPATFSTTRVPIELKDTASEEMDDPEIIEDMGMGKNTTNATTTTDATMDDMNMDEEMDMENGTPEVKPEEMENAPEVKPEETENGLSEAKPEDGDMTEEEEVAVEKGGERALRGRVMDLIHNLV